MKNAVRTVRNGLIWGLAGWVAFIAFLVWVMPT
jgi:predicted cobalt transporter CbtA